MPVSNDVLFATVVDLSDYLEVFFYDDHPAWNRVWKKLDQRQSGGEYHAFDVVTNGPGTAVQVVTGNEAYTYSTRQMLQQGRVYMPEMIYKYAVLGKDMRRLNGKNGVIQLVKKYPELGMQDYQQEVCYQFVAGASNLSGVGGVTTLNGQTTYSPDGTALAGVLDFQATTAQTDTVFNLPKQAAAGGVPGWYNQNEQITSFSSHGRRKMMSVYNRCKQRGGRMGPPDLFLCDTDTFENYYDDLDDQVRYATQFRGQEGKDAVDGLKFLNADVIPDVAIDDFESTQFSSLNGLGYFINTKAWKMLRLGGGKEGDFDATAGNFTPRTIGQIPGQDAYGHENVTALQPVCTHLKSQGTVYGSALS